jgi:hypothetical protein
MSTFKTTSGDYTVSLGPYDSGNAKWGGTMNINGNLNVAGNITYVTDIAVNDAFIIVAANNTGTVQDMGLVATKSTGSYAGLRFDTVANVWQVSSSVNIDGSPVAAYSTIATGNASVSGSNTQVQFNDSGSFGATANLTFNKSLNQLSVLNGSQVLGNVGTTPSSVANSVIIYNNAPGPGATGLYVVSSTTNDEVTAYNKAKLLAIIL